MARSGDFQAASSIACCTVSSPDVAAASTVSLAGTRRAAAGRADFGLRADRLVAESDPPNWMYSTPISTTASTPIRISLPGVVPALFRFNGSATAHPLPRSGLGVRVLQAKIDHQGSLHRIFVRRRAGRERQALHFGEPG